MPSLGIGHRAGCTIGKSRTYGWRWRRITDVLPTSVQFHPWRLGFKQSSLSPIAQALHGHSVHIFRCPLALSGLGQLFASESLTLHSGHLWWQFLPCVTRRTLSPHTAPQWYGSCHGHFLPWMVHVYCFPPFP